MKNITMTIKEELYHWKEYDIYSVSQKGNKMRTTYHFCLFIYKAL